MSICLKIIFLVSFVAFSSCSKTLISKRETVLNVGQKAKDFYSTHGAQKGLNVVRNSGQPESLIGEFPYIASIGYDIKGQTEFRCEGSLISEKFVVTAAHCVNRRRQLPVTVRLGRVSNLILN